VRDLALDLKHLHGHGHHHTYERFMTPFRPLIHGLAGCGVEWIAIAVWHRFRGRVCATIDLMTNRKSAGHEVRHSLQQRLVRGLAQRVCELS